MSNVVKFPFQNEFIMGQDPLVTFIRGIKENLAISNYLNNIPSIEWDYTQFGFVGVDQNKRGWVNIETTLRRDLIPSFPLQYNTQFCKLKWLMLPTHDETVLKPYTEQVPVLDKILDMVTEYLDSIAVGNNQTKFICLAVVDVMVNHPELEFLSYQKEEGFYITLIRRAADTLPAILIDIGIDSLPLVLNETARLFAETKGPRFS